MTDLPTLIVDGDPDDWVERSPLHTPPFPLHDTVRIDGPLPTVPIEGYTGRRPLRVGDRVTLATFDCRCPNCHTFGCADHKPVPFATATVTKTRKWQRPEGGYIVTVTDVEVPGR